MKRLAVWIRAIADKIDPPAMQALPVPLPRRPRMTTREIGSSCLMENASPLRKYRDQTGKTLAALAEVLSVNKSTVLRWEEGKVPVERIADVERETGISRHDLRPDIFGPADAGAAA